MAEKWTVNGVDDEELGDALREECLTKTLFRLKTDDPDDYRQLEDIAYSKELAETLKAKHGDSLIEIINERFI
jgi:hypothetical protein